MAEDLGDLLLPVLSSMAAYQEALQAEDTSHWAEGRQRRGLELRPSGCRDVNHIPLVLTLPSA